MPTLLALQGVLLGDHRKGRNVKHAGHAGVFPDFHAVQHRPCRDVELQFHTEQGQPAGVADNLREIHRLPCKEAVGGDGAVIGDLLQSTELDGAVAVVQQDQHRHRKPYDQQSERVAEKSGRPCQKCFHGQITDGRNRCARWERERSAKSAESTACPHPLCGRSCCGTPYGVPKRGQRRP